MERKKQPAAYIGSASERSHTNTSRTSATVRHVVLAAGSTEGSEPTWGRQTQPYIFHSEFPDSRFIYHSAKDAPLLASTTDSGASAQYHSLRLRSTGSKQHYNDFLNAAGGRRACDQYRCVRISSSESHKSRDGQTIIAPQRHPPPKAIDGSAHR